MCPTQSRRDRRHGAGGDYFDALPSTLRGRVRVVLANLPYVPTEHLEHLPREARLYEPRGALDGGPDGLVPFRRVLTEAAGWLGPAGSYLTELSVAQLDAAERFAERLGYTFEATVEPNDSGALVRLSAA